MQPCFINIQRYLLAEEKDETRLFVMSDSSGATQTDVKPQAWIEQETTQPIIIMQGAAVAPSKNDDIVVKRMDLIVDPGHLVLVHGPVACGKSMFLKGITGEAVIARGSLYIRGGNDAISYCGQSPWMQNATVQQNIIGDNRYEHDWYCKVVVACLLDEDLKSLPGGDKFMVGENGSRLSGGQQHRTVSGKRLDRKIRRRERKNVTQYPLANLG